MVRATGFSLGVHIWTGIKLLISRKKIVNGDSWESHFGPSRNRAGRLPSPSRHPRPAAREPCTGRHRRRLGVCNSAESRPISAPGSTSWLCQERTLASPTEVEHRSLTTLGEKLVKIGAKVVSHGRYVEQNRWRGPNGRPSSTIGLKFLTRVPFALRSYSHQRLQRRDHSIRKQTAEHTD